VLSLGGEEVAAWAGSPDTTVAELRRCVAQQLGQHVLRVALTWKGEQLADGATLVESQLPERASLQLLVSDKLVNEKWEELQQKLKALEYGSDTSEVAPLAALCLEAKARPVDEIAVTVRDSCEEAGSMTDMPDDWYEQLAAHPDSRCDTPCLGHSDLIHYSISDNIRLGDKPFFKAGPHSDKVDYPEWGWQARIAGTPLDMAARKLEVLLEKPPAWGGLTYPPKEAGELDVAQENFMLLLEHGFKMSRVEVGGRQLCSQEGIYDAEMVWKRTLLQRAELPYEMDQATCDQQGCGRADRHDLGSAWW